MENATLREADKLEDMVAVHRDVDLGKGQMQDPTHGKETCTDAY